MAYNHALLGPARELIGLATKCVGVGQILARVAAVIIHLAKKPQRLREEAVQLQALFVNQTKGAGQQISMINALFALCRISVLRQGIFTFKRGWKRKCFTFIMSFAFW